MHFYKSGYLFSWLSGKRKFALIACMLALHFVVRSQHTLMQTYNINDGLVSNQVRGFYQDKKGFIWIITWEGLSRFDGHQFRNYTLTEGLAHPLINGMIEGRDGAVYIAENDGTVDVIVNGEVQKALRQKHETVINKFIPEPSGRILAPTDDAGVSVFDEKAIFPLNSTGLQISVVDVISNGDVFIVCGTKSGVMRHDHSFLKLWPETLIDYKCVLKDKRSQIWVGSSKGLSMVRQSPDHSQNYDLIPTVYANETWSRWDIRDILEATDGSIWVAGTGGLVQIKPDESWRLYDKSDGLLSDYITTVFEDETGFLWIGTDQGIAQLDLNNTIDLFTISEDLPNSIPSDIQPTLDGGAYVISNSSSVFRIHRDEEFMRVDLGNGGSAFQFLIIGDDTLVSTNRGRYKLVGNAVESWASIPYSSALQSLVMENGCIFSSSVDTITISCSDGSHTDTIMNDMVFSMAADAEGHIWIGTLNLGVYRAHVTKNAFGKIDLEWKDFNDYLPEKTIRSLHVDAKGNIWIGTRYSGLIRLYHNPLSGNYTTQIFDRSDGFISDYIKSIVSEEQGNIWVGTHAGIEKLIPTPNGFRTFGFSRVHNFFATISRLAIGPNQTVWCTSTSGVARIRDCRYDTISPSPVYITSVSTAEYTLVDPQVQLPLALKHNQNFMSIEFSSNDHHNGKQIAYSYRLAGSQDTMWSKPQPVHKVSFANLLPGKYRFDVRMLGWNGALGDKTSFYFRVRPPFWQQVWFVALSFIAVFGLLYAFYRYRISQFKRIQEVRDRIASDLHDEIGSSLTHVNILSEIGKKHASSDDHPQQIFKRIGEEMQSSSEALDDIIWSVSSRTDTMEDLISRMRRYASELFELKSISFSLTTEGLSQDRSIGLELRRDFYLIYKELLRNVLRHAAATEVKMEIRGEGQVLWLVVSDNGHGFDPSKPTSRQGLHSIQRRIAQWRGKFVVDSSPEKGTVIQVGLPLKRSLSFRNS